MVLDIEVRDSGDVAAVVKALGQHADKKAIRRELHKGLNSVTKDMRGAMVATIPAALPRRGGLADEVKGAIRSRTKVKGGKWAGVSLVYSSRQHDIRTLTGARLRHPVFGNKRVWVDQTEGVEPEVFMGKFEDQKPEVQRAIVRVLEGIAQKVADI